MRAPLSAILGAAGQQRGCGRGEGPFYKRTPGTGHTLKAEESQAVASKGKSSHAKIRGSGLRMWVILPPFGASGNSWVTFTETIEEAFIVFGRRMARECPESRPFSVSDLDFEMNFHHRRSPSGNFGEF